MAEDWSGFKGVLSRTSSINFRRSVRYGLGVLATSLQAFAHRRGLAHFAIFDPGGRRLDPSNLPSGAAVASERTASSL